MVLETKHKNWTLNVILGDTIHKSLLVTLLTATIVFSFASTCTVFCRIVHVQPSVPEFTVKFEAHPYDVPPTTTTTIDQYTGEKKVTTTSGSTVENKSIEITIKNQPFTPYTDANDYEINLYYHVRTKGHFGEDWKDFYKFRKTSQPDSQIQSNSEYTIISIREKYPEGAQIDFQVEAIVGHYYDEFGGLATTLTYILAVDEKSGLSESQTITIPTPTEPPTSSPTVNHTNTSAPTSPAFTKMEAILGVTIIIAVLFRGLGFLGYLFRRK